MNIYIKFKFLNMKHLKTFEFYFYDQEKEMDDQEGKIMPPFGEEEFGEEEAGEDQPTSRYQRGPNGEMSRHETELRYPELADDDDDDYEFDDENYVEGSDDLDYQWRKLQEDPEFAKKMAEKQKGSEGQHVSKFDTFSNESTCSSCNCKECECGGMANEAKKSKSSSYKKSGLKNPEKADLNKDKKISGYEKTRGKAIQKSIEGEDKESPSKGKGKGKDKSEPSEKQKKGLPKELVDAMKKGLRD